MGQSRMVTSTPRLQHRIIRTLCLTGIVRFKLHLRPQRKSVAHVAENIPALPPGKSAVQVFADFLRYLHQCACIYIEESHAGGAELWRGLQANTEFVLTHPNGWEGGQQGLMRKAAVMAGLVDDTDSGHQRLSFVTEGEASLHFCIQSGLTSEAIKVRLPAVS